MTGKKVKALLFFVLIAVALLALAGSVFEPQHAKGFAAIGTIAIIGDAALWICWKVQREI